MRYLVKVLRNIILFWINKCENDSLLLFFCHDFVRKVYIMCFEFFTTFFCLFLASILVDATDFFGFLFVTEVSSSLIYSTNVVCFAVCLFIFSVCCLCSDPRITIFRAQFRFIKNGAGPQP